VSERILEARYTSPGGTEAAFSYETVKRETELKTGIFTFPSRDGAHVQHQGMGAKSFPLICFFSGISCMDDADAFEAMLIERGVGELQIPYGTFKVVPTGKIQREDNFVAGVGQSSVTITFTETIVDEEAAALEAVAADEIAEQYEEFADAACEDFATALDVDDISEQLAIVSSLDAQTQLMTDSLQSLMTADRSKFADFLTAVKELKSNIQNLYKKGKGITGDIESVYAKGLNIARLTLRIMKMPADIAVSLSEKIKGYSQLTAGLINQFKNDPFGIAKIKNAYTVAKLALTGLVAAISSGSATTIAEVAASGGMANSGSPAERPASSPLQSSGSNSTGGNTGQSADAGTASRAEAVEAANCVAEIAEQVMEWSDTKTGQDVFVDSDSAAYLALACLTQNSVQLILNAAFALPMQRTVTLGRDRQVVELCAELYGTVDSGVIDQFIMENNLSIDEIGLIPMGRKVSYYVQSA
jgi:hypothetical protein